MLLFSAAVIALIIFINLDVRRRMAKLSPTEREELIRKTDYDLSIW